MYIEPVNSIKYMAQNIDYKSIKSFSTHSFVADNG